MPTDTESLQSVEGMSYWGRAVRILITFLVITFFNVQSLSTSPVKFFRDEVDQLSWDYMVAGVGYGICIAVIIVFKASTGFKFNLREATMGLTMIILMMLKTGHSIWCSWSKEKHEMMEFSFLPTVVDVCNSMLECFLNKKSRELLLLQASSTSNAGIELQEGAGNTYTELQRRVVELETTQQQIRGTLGLHERASNTNQELLGRVNKVEQWKQELINTNVKLQQQVKEVEKTQQEFISQTNIGLQQQFDTAKQRNSELEELLNKNKELHEQLVNAERKNKELQEKLFETNIMLHQRSMQQQLDAITEKLDQFKNLENIGNLG